MGDFDENAPWGEGPERERLANATAVGTVPNDEEAGVSGGDGVRATLPQLCARVASLHCLARKLAALEREVPARFARMQRSQGVGETFVPGDGGDGGDGGTDRVANFDPTNPYAPKRRGVWFDGLLDGARQTLSSCSRKVADYVACKVVYWDLRRLFIEGLYRVGVGGGERAGAVAARLEAALSEIAERLPGAAAPAGSPRSDTNENDDDAYCASARDEVVHALLRATTQGYMWVMLDGGVGRVFAETDAAALEEDLFCFRDLFLAGGEGVPEPTVDAVMRRADRLLMVMSLDTPTLCDAYLEQEAADRSRGTRRGRGRARRVAGRRRDRRRAGRRRRVRRQHPAPRAVPPRGSRGEQVFKGALPPPQGGRGERDEHRQGEGKQRRGVLPRKGQRRAKRRRVTRRAERRAFVDEERI